MGGVYFVTTSLICSMILFATVRLSWDSQAVAIANNFAGIVAINISVNGYIDNVIIPEARYAGSLPFTNHPYNPLEDFNSMMRSAGLVSHSGGSKEYWASWDGKIARVQFGEFTTLLGSKVRPHLQQSAVESY